MTLRAPRARLLLALLLLIAGPALSTTYVLGPDAGLFDQADLVAEVEIASALPIPGEAATDHLAVVLRVFGGRAPGTTLLIRQPGGTDARGRILELFGGPVLTDGERAIVFLEAHPDGTWGLLHWSLGIFHQRPGGKRTVAVRALDEATVLDLDLGPGVDPAREYEPFARWLADRGRGVRRAADYFVPVDRAEFTSRYTLMRSGGVPVRWFDFDSGRTVNWRIGGGSQGTGPQFTTAQNAWNQDPASMILYAVNGTTASQAGFLRSDGVNALIFNDPNREVAGRFDCRTGGVLAAGGFWRQGRTLRYRNQSFHPIIEADIVVNDGMDCFLRSGARGNEELYAHELGHTLGLGHTNQSNALMWFAIHDDGRGARLHPDDLAGAAFLYGTGGGGASPKPPDPAGPPAPSDLTVRAVSQKAIRLDWTDNSSDEDSFEIWIKPPGSGWEKWKNVAADATGARYGKAEPGQVYTFTVRARRGRAYSDFSNRPQVKTPTSGGGGGQGGGGSALADPDGLTVEPVSPSVAELTWTDNASAEDAYEIWIKEPGLDWRLWGSTAADTTGALVTGLVPGKTYRFRVRARRGADVSGYTGIVKVRTETPESVPIEAPSQLRGRFTSPTEVLLSWRDNSGNESRFEVWWRKGPGEWALWGKKDRDVRFAVIDVAAGATYRFRVRARRGAQLSDYSNVVKIKTQAAASSLR